MKDRKRRLELLSFYDHTGIERHLARMAQRGWMIERMSNYFWTYRRIQPQKLQFTVSYFPKASGFDSGPSEGQRELFALCAQTGWQLACTWFQMQVFYSGQPDPTPIHTEPALEVEAIHRGCRKNYLRWYFILSAVSLVLTALFVSSLISDTLRILASPNDFLMGMGWTLLFFFCLSELTAYYRWRRRARRAADQGMFLDTPSTAGIQRGVLALLGLCVLWWLINLLAAGNSLMLWCALLVTLAMAAVTLLVHTVKEGLRGMGAPRGVNRALTTAASFLIAFVLMGGVIAAGVQLFTRVEKEELPLYAQAPLEVSDLAQTSYGNYLTTASPDQSLLLARLYVHQRHGLGEEGTPDIPELEYEIYRVKLPALYGFCEEQLKRLVVLSAFWQGELEAQDPSAWGAERAYRLVMEGGAPANVYLLCYPDTLARVELSWAPTPAQMAIAGEKLAGADL